MECRTGRLRDETSTDLSENAAGRVMTALHAACRLWVLKADKWRTRRSLEQAAYQHGECGRQSTLSEESKGERKEKAVAAGKLFESLCLEAPGSLAGGVVY